VDGVLLKPLPYAEPDRIVRVREKPPWQKDNTVFEYMAAQSGNSPTLTGNGEPEQLRGSRVSAHYFDIFGIQTVLGRTFAGDEDRPGKDHVAILSHALWETRFGSDRKIAGRTILLDGEPNTVIGVLPAG
jgi:hypothetical protein